MSSIQPSEVPSNGKPAAAFVRGDLRGVSRRAMLGAAAAVGGAAVFSSVQVPMTSPARAADVWATLRTRRCEQLTGAASVSAEPDAFADALGNLVGAVRDQQALIDTSSGRTRVFTDRDLDGTHSKLVTDTYNGLQTMAKGWYTPETELYQDERLLTQLLEGLRTVHDLRYHVDAPTNSEDGLYNWWDFEIGAPKRLANILALLGDALPAADQDRYIAAIQDWVADPWLHDGRPTVGANRTSKCLLTIIQSIVNRDGDRLAHARDGLPVTVRHVAGDNPDGTAGEGLWADGSFIQHEHAYTVSYGRLLLGELTTAVTLLHDTEWDLGGDMGNLYDAVDTAFAPVIHDGRAMSFVNGRAISKAQEDELALGGALIGTIAELVDAGVADETTREGWRRRCLGWIERIGTDLYTDANPARIAVLRQLGTGGVTGAPEPEDSVIFRNMARAVHRRNGWAFAIAMNSNRIGRYESINGNNLHGFHTGAGMTYLYDSDNTQFTDNFWPTVNPYELPGTTIDKKPIPDAGGQDHTDWKWAGGATDGAYSAVGMSLSAATTSLRAKKSWFCFDEVIFCLGRSITGGDGYPVQTIVENRNLHQDGTNALLINGSPWTETDESFADGAVRWAHLEGVGGYIFPRSADQTVRVTRKTQNGSWSAIDADGSTEIHSRNYLLLAVEHGTDPADGLYSYLVVPGASASRTEEIATARGVSVVGHNTHYHGVHQPSTGLTMINFWHGGHACPLTPDAGAVSVDLDCSVIVQETADTLRVTVANPLRNGRTVRVSVRPTQDGWSFASASNGVSTDVLDGGANVILQVAAGSYGSSYAARFTRWT